MAEPIKAIETVYGGYRFRSRLEARWAVFFDTMKVKYEYEREGYNLKGIYYLPDFWLPDYYCHVEIKGQPPTQQEVTKAESLRDTTGFAMAIFHGLPTENAGNVYCWDESESTAGSSDWDVILCNECMGDLVFGLIWHDPHRAIYASEDFSKVLRRIIRPADNPLFFRNYTDHALNNAKQARFEHGETPFTGGYQNAYI